MKLHTSCLVGILGDTRSLFFYMTLERGPLLSSTPCPGSLPHALQLLSPSYSFFDNNPAPCLPSCSPTIPPLHSLSSLLILLLFWNPFLCTTLQASKAFPKLYVTSLANCFLHLSTGQLWGRGAGIFLRIFKSTVH